MAGAANGGAENMVHQLFRACKKGGNVGNNFAVVAKNVCMCDELIQLSDVPYTTHYLSSRKVTHSVEADVPHKVFCARAHLAASPFTQ